MLTVSGYQYNSFGVTCIKVVLDVIFFCLRILIKIKFYKIKYW